MPEPIKYRIIGGGRWGTWLYSRLKEVLAEADIRLLPGRALHAALSGTNRLASDQEALDLGEDLLLDIKDSVALLCVSDSAIQPMIELLEMQEFKPKMLIHASGAAPIPQSMIPCGVLWPLDSISAESRPSWSDLPFVIQASTPALLMELRLLSRKLRGESGDTVSAQIVEVEDDQARARLHLGAVLTQNFSNLLWTLTSELLAEIGADHKVYLPMLRHHLENLESIHPMLLQTGPAIRGDQVSIARHEELLRSRPEWLDIYRQLSRAIQKRHS